MKIKGVWLPIITPFNNDKIDFDGYKRMIDHYIGKGVTGILPLGTTGESPTLDDYEYESIIEKTMEYVNGRVPVIVGLGGNNTRKVIDKLKVVERNKVSGILSVCPYYNRPDQRGIFEHFRSIAESTDLDIIIYNIPYRTGRNIENSTIHRLAEIKNIIGVKDASGDFKQTSELLLSPPKDFSIMTGEDVLFYSTLVLGGDGGILASAHIKTESFIDIYNKVQENDFASALATWKTIAKIIPLLFQEPNPTPIKFCLKEIGLIQSDEARLPLMPITEELKIKLRKELSI